MTQPTAPVAASVAEQRHAIALNALALLRVHAPNETGVRELLAKADALAAMPAEKRAEMERGWR